MSALCVYCKRPIYWDPLEAWCHTDQKYGGRWKCPVCGYEGDLAEYSQRVAAKCPRCGSERIYFDHHAVHPEYGHENPAHR